MGVGSVRGCPLIHKIVSLMSVQILIVTQNKVLKILVTLNGNRIGEGS